VDGTAVRRNMNDLKLNATSLGVILVILVVVAAVAYVLWKKSHPDKVFPMRPKPDFGGQEQGVQAVDNTAVNNTVVQPYVDPGAVRQPSGPNVPGPAVHGSATNPLNPLNPGNPINPGSPYPGNEPAYPGTTPTAAPWSPTGTPDVPDAPRYDNTTGPNQPIY
jgi:hypothetical protein